MMYLAEANALSEIGLHHREIVNLSSNHPEYFARIRRELSTRSKMKTQRASLGTKARKPECPDVLHYCIC